MVTIPRGRVIDVRTGAPVSSAQVMIYDATGKLHSTLTTNARGEFPTTFPRGEYGITVYAPGYELASDASSHVPQNADVVYEGGTFTVIDDGESIDMIVPVRGEGHGGVSRWGFLRAFWQSIFFSLTRKAHTKDTSHGIIRDATTKAPLDLAVVRLFEEKTDRLIATRISDIHGRFSLLPSPGVYRMTITREGYTDVTREHITISATDESFLFAPVDLVQEVVL